MDGAIRSTNSLAIGRIGRTVNDEQTGPGRYGRLKLFRGDLESRFDTCPDDDGFPVCQPDHIRVGNPVGGRDDDLVAGVEQCLGQVEETLLATAGDEDLIRPVFQTVVTAEFRYNRLLEFSGSVNGGVAREPGVDRLYGGGPDMVGRIEIRFAGTEPDDVLAGRAQFGNMRRYCEGGGGLDALYPVSEPDLVQSCYPVFFGNGASANHT